MELNRFNGLNNVADPMRGTGTGTKEAQTWQWQQVADNVDGTDAHGLVRREGYTPFLSATISGAYSTIDFSRLYIVAGGDLMRVNADGSVRVLDTGLSGTAYWAEINDVVYLSCGATKLQIWLDSSVTPWGVPVPATPDAKATTGHLFSGLVQICLTYTDSTGLEGGASPAVDVMIGENGGVTVTNIPQITGYTAQLYATEPDGTVFYHAASLPIQTAYTLNSLPQGSELTTQFLDAPPTGQHIAFLGANAYLADYNPALDQTVIWFSQAQGYHLFNLNTDYFVVPGEVTQLHGSGNGLVVATQARIYLYNDDQLLQLAEYGAVPGQHADLGRDGKTYFWTKRGLCRVTPFENLTESVVSVAPGVQAGGGVINTDGYSKYVAVIHSGGDAFNARSIT